MLKLVSAMHLLVIFFIACWFCPRNYRNWAKGIGEGIRH